MTIEELSTDTYQSCTRNKLIAEAFYLTNNIEKYGSGYIRIRKELEAYPELTFSVEEMGGGVLVTFKQNEGVNEGVNGLYNVIKSKPGLRTPELARQLETPPKTIERWLKELKKNHQIIFRGADKTGGYFVIEKTE